MESIRKRQQNFVVGEWVSARDGDTIEDYWLLSLLTKRFRRCYSVVPFLEIISSDFC